MKKAVIFLDKRETTQAFLSAMRASYFNNTAKTSADYLRGECRMLSFLNIDKERQYQSGELAKHLNITTARTAATLRTLEKKGYVTRSVCGGDKRKIFVSITPAGSRFIEKKREDVCLFFDRIFDELSESDRRDFIRLISEITEIAGKMK